MTLQAIRVVNIKGIHNKTFTLNIIPNKPSILYAPNGYGKTSLAIGFDLLNSNRLNVSKENLYQNDENNDPILELTYERSDGTIATLQATKSTNGIAAEIDHYVIRNLVRPKPGILKFNGRSHPVASLHVDPIVLINTIPEDKDLGYAVTPIRHRFGANGKVLPNLATAIENGSFISFFYENYRQLDRLCQKLNSKAIQEFKDRINQRNGSTEDLHNWMEANEVPNLNTIEPLQILADGLNGVDLGFTLHCERMLAVMEMLDIYAQDKDNFKAGCLRKLYELERQSYIETFRAFNSTWKDIRPKESDGKFVLEFPKANHISNGQRDILCLVASLEQARRKLKKGIAILIIDEVFDYLDEGNLVAAQYYINEFINDFKVAGKRIYPLILTHLNPQYFRNYAFSKMKVYYLDQRAATVNASFTRLIENRENATISPEVDQLLFHYHTGQINKRPEFTALNIRPTWGEGNNFVNYVNTAVGEYINSQPGYDPFAVCCAVRRRVEENVYNLIAGAAEKATFLATHKTKDKLDYAETIGVPIPEYYYLLGIVYNDGMHWKQGMDNESTLKAKLENGTIRKLISDVFK